MFDFYPEVNLSREDLLAKIAGAVKESRFKHMLGVEKAAIALAEKYGVDPHKASLAGLLHDYCKEVDDEIFLALIDKYNLDADLKIGIIIFGMGKSVFIKYVKILGLKTKKFCVLLRFTRSEIKKCLVLLRYCMWQITLKRDEISWSH